jgi:hypothetical protein
VSLTKKHLFIFLLNFLFYKLNNQPILIENFILTINFNENLDELIEIKAKIDEDISKTRSQDKGGENGKYNLKNPIYFTNFFFTRPRNKVTIIKSTIFKPPY